MPSRLQHQHSFEPFSAETTRSVFPHSALPSQQKKQKMSLSQTYYIASSARSKLGREAARSDHNLRRLVGHANLLDSLMLELQDAEREQERWFNQTVMKAQKSEEPRHIQWADTIVEEPAEEADSDDSDSDDSDYEDEADLIKAIIPRRISLPPVLVTPEEEDEEEEEYFDDLEDEPELALVRTHSRSPSSPPELIEDSDSEDEASPPNSPPQSTVMDFVFDDKTIAEQHQGSLFDDAFLVPAERNAPLIAALA